VLKRNNMDQQKQYSTRSLTLDFSRDATDEKDPLVTVVGGANESDAAALNGFTTLASVNNLSWSPS